MGYKLKYYKNKTNPTTQAKVHIFNILVPSQTVAAQEPTVHTFGFI